MRASRSTAGRNGARSTRDREVMLSAGAFGSPQLLLLSGIGPREELARHGIRRCGTNCRASARNLVDHVDLALVYRSDRTAALMGITLGTALRAVPGYFRVATIAARDS